MRWLVCVLVLASACGEDEATTTSDPHVAVRPEPTPEPTKVTTVERQAADPPTSPSGPPTGDLANCEWFADPRAPEETGPRSLAALDQALTTALRREAWVLGRVRGRARGCPDVSVGIAIAGEEGRAADPDNPIYSDYGDAPERTVGERGDERRTPPWDPDAPYPDHTNAAIYSVDVVLFRVSHGAAGVENLRTTVLIGGQSSVLQHFLVLGDLDRDGRSEARIEVRSVDGNDDASETHAGHKLWIVDVAAFHTELAIDVQIQNDLFVEGIGYDNTRAELTFRDMNGDGHRDAVVRGRSEGADPMMADENGEAMEYREFFTHVHRYDPIADVFVRVEQQPSAAGP